MASGTVKWFDPKKGYGFIINKEGKDVLVHYTGLEGEGFRSLKQNQVVEYEEFESPTGLRGRNVRVVEAKQESKSEAD